MPCRPRISSGGKKAWSMTDYRFKALQDLLATETSTFNIKEGGGLLAGFFDEDAAAAQREYLELVKEAFRRIRAGTLDESETTQTFMALCEVFTAEGAELEALCQGNPQLAQGVSAWHHQTQDLCDALEAALSYFQDGNPEILTEAFEVISSALTERLPLYGQMALLEPQAADDDEDNDKAPEGEEDFDDSEEFDGDEGHDDQDCDLQEGEEDVDDRDQTAEG